LLGVINGLVDKGNTVIVIEHNLDVIKTADHVIDMGPEGGSGGGLVIAEGTPEEIAADSASYTGQFLAPVLAGRSARVGRSGSTDRQLNGGATAKVVAAQAKSDASPQAITSARVDAAPRVGAVGGQVNGVTNGTNGAAAKKPVTAPGARSAALATAQSSPARTDQAKAGSSASPTNTAPTKTAPTKTAPTKTAPTKTAPTKTAPTKMAPTKTAPTKMAPTKTAPTKMAPTKSVPGKPASAKTAVAKATIDPAAAATKARRKAAKLI
jgi:hypothetical protein